MGRVSLVVVFVASGCSLLFEGQSDDDTLIESSSSGGGQNRSWQHEVGVEISLLVAALGIPDTGTVVQGLFFADQPLRMSSADASNGMTLQVWSLEEPPAGLNEFRMSTNSGAPVHGISFALVGVRDQVDVMSQVGSTSVIDIPIVSSSVNLGIVMVARSNAISTPVSGSETQLIGPHTFYGQPGSSENSSIFLDVNASWLFSSVSVPISD